MPAKFDKAKTTLIATMYRNGTSFSDISSQLGISIGSVYNCVRRAGGSVRRFTEINRKYDLNPPAFSKPSTPEVAWALGLLTADGCVRPEYNSVNLSLRTSDKDAIEQFVGIVEYTGPIREYVRGIRSDATIDLRSEQMVADLAKIGVGPRKSLTIKPWNAPTKLVPHYLRGLMDGNGHIMRQSDAWSVGLCGTEAIVRYFAEFVSTITDSRAEPRPSGSVWQINYRGISAPKAIAKALYKDAPCAMKRKSDLAHALMLTVSPRRKYKLQR